MLEVQDDLVIAPQYIRCSCSLDMNDGSFTNSLIGTDKSQCSIMDKQRFVVWVPMLYAIFIHLAATEYALPLLKYY
jgi:hypothetical protein